MSSVSVSVTILLCPFCIVRSFTLLIVLGCHPLCPFLCIACLGRCTNVCMFTGIVLLAHGDYVFIWELPATGADPAESTKDVLFRNVVDCKYVDSLL